jgi:hypothetical protein
MKYFFFFVLLSCTYSSKKDKDKQSMFLYIPSSVSSLETEGYKTSLPNLYWKKVVDTSENIQVGNLDSGQFSKTFYIRIRTKDTTSIVDFIATKADSVLLRFRHSLLIKYLDNIFLIDHGYSHNKTMYILTYRNPKVYNDRIYAIRTLKAMLGEYPKPEDQKQIYHALGLIDGNWLNLSDKTPGELAMPTEEKH